MPVKSRKPVAVEMPVKICSRCVAVKHGKVALFILLLLILLSLSRLYEGVSYNSVLYGSGPIYNGANAASPTVQ